MKQSVAPESGPQFVVGLMSGTSADGIEAVVVEILGGDHLKARLVAHRSRPFPRELRRRILHACLHGTVAEICELNFLLGEHFARAALAVIRDAGLRPEQISVIGSHGQTVHHLPRAKYASTLQIGEPAVIAERTGITTVADFRVRDMAAGGQGAPLVPYADWALYTDVDHPRVLQNIGGIANLTFLPAGGSLEQVMAFDTGPGNMVIDAVVAELGDGRLAYDRNGAWAAKGRVSDTVLASMMAHPFLCRRPPKTTGREEFGEMFVGKVLAHARRLRLPNTDVVATVTAFTAATIAQARERFVWPKLTATERSQTQVIVGGGGTKNRTLMRMLAERVAPAALLTQEDLGWSSSAKEAVAFAIMAYETMRGRPSNVPSATGARRAVVLGKIVPGGAVMERDLAGGEPR